MQPVVHIFVDRPISPRFDFIAKVIVEDHWKAKMEVYTQEAPFCAAAGPKIWYSNHPPPSGTPVVQVPVDAFLQSPYTPSLRPEIKEWKVGAPVPFDLFSAMFFFLSRWEEYQPPNTDIHGRMPGKDSYASQLGFLHRPIVDEWSNQLAGSLEQIFQGFRVKEFGYQFLPTYDIDQAWCFRHKGWMRNLGGTLRDLSKGNWRDITYRLNVLSGQEPDPFDQFAQIQQWHHEYDLPALFFWQIGERGAFDKNISPQKPAFRELIQSVSTKFDVGLHPSYRTGNEPDQFKEEVQELNSIIGQPVQKSRQHFLRVQWPQTYRQLLSQNVTHDYSMGFADQIGFRAGTARPFPWYDLLKEETTPLQITPFQLMDVTARQYLGLQAEETLELAKKIASSIRKTGGWMVTLWHNSSLSDYHGWGPWKETYENILRECQ